MKHQLAAVTLIVGIALAQTTSATATTSGPRIDTTTLTNGGYACSSTTPTRSLSVLGRILQAVGYDDSAPSNSTFRFTFAIWSPNTPNERTHFVVTTYQSGALATLNVPTAYLTDGSTYNWHVEMSDASGISKWSPTCTFVYDVTSPAGPAITSGNYPQGLDSFAPVGQPAQFTFTDSDPSVYAYQFAWGTILSVNACRDGGGSKGQLQCPEVLDNPGVVAADPVTHSATLVINPVGDGPQYFSVAALDRAGNRSGIVTYETFVPSSDPTVAVLGPRPICTSRVEVAVAPNPAFTAIRSYQYTVDNGPVKTVKAAADNSAVFWIPVNSQTYDVRVWSIAVNGFVSTQADQLIAADEQPTVQADVYVNSGQPVGGVGVVGAFTFSPPIDGSYPNSYVYRFGNGPRQVVAADPGNLSATIHWTPTQSGPVTLTVSSAATDTGSSCSARYSFVVAG